MPSPTALRSRKVRCSFDPMNASRVICELRLRARTCWHLALGVIALSCALGGPALAIPPKALLELQQYQQFSGGWAEVRGDIVARRWEEAAGGTLHLVTIRQELGLPNAYELSAALLQAAHSARSDGASAASTKLAAAAAALSPDMAAARFEEASLLFSAAPFGVGDQLKAIRQAVDSLPSDLGATFALMGNTASALLHIVVLVALLFGLAMLLRYRRPMAHDIRRLLPDGVTAVQGMLLLATLSVAPFMLGLGLLTAAILWILASALYQKTGERVLSVTVLAMVAATPFLTAYTVQAVRYAGSPQAVLERCNNSLCGARDRDRLGEMSKTTEALFAANYTLALQHKRAQASDKGDYTDARRYLDQALRAEERVEAMVLLGNVQYLEALADCPAVLAGDVAARERFESRLVKASGSFKKATELDGDSLAAHYNAMVVYRQLGNNEQAEQHDSRARSLGRAEVERFTRGRDGNPTRCQMGRQGNRHLMDARLSHQSLRAAVVAQASAPDTLLLPMAGALTGRTGPVSVGIAGGIAACLVLLLAFAGSLLRTTRHCALCHGVADPETRVNAARGRSVCVECVQADVHRGISDAKETWTRDQAIQSAAFQRSRTQRWVTWVAPGFGQLLRGAPVRGLAFLAIVYGCAILAFGLHQIIADPRQPPTLGGGRLLFFGGVALVAYILALFDAHASRNDGRPEDGVGRSIGPPS